MKNTIHSDQKGRTIIVTGANTGLGYETALELAKMVAKVIMACRNIAKAEAARDRIIKTAPAADLVIMEIDLSSLNSIRKFAENFKSKFNKLDVLINNAGVMTPPYSKTEDGFELQFGANYLGHFLLTGLLLDLIVKTEHSRILTLSSAVHKNGTINFDDLQSEKEYDRMKAYAQSKLACLLFTYELQRRLEKAGHNNTISVACHPGIAMTDLSRNMSKFQYYLIKYTLAPFMAQSAKKGALPTLLAATGEAQGGDYFGPTGFNEFKGKPGIVSSSELSKDEKVANKLWTVSEKLVGLEYL
ncbi:MAG: SDR family NAD(P)-dependent oxidoreductase [Saprospiraceae bacterium]|nr:SDR family NAD(P)-dependent oxidoreductase [Saprospiraceae bacterium]